VRHLPEAAERFAALRASPTMVLSPSEWAATVIARMLPPRELGAPNVAGILKGTDPALRQEFIVISAHMDHVGGRCRGVSAADAICNGADDDASGTAGVVALAAALSQSGARPKRSVIFLTVSAEERGLWGSRIFAASPPVDIESSVANFNMDMIGRNWRDTVVAIGKGHSDLGSTVDEVAAAHPELGMTVVDDLWPRENLYTRSDHFNFARRGVPVLFFTSGLHEDYHAVTDSPEKIDAEKEARILRLVFHLTQEIGNRAARPQWKKESYDAVVGR
jgi:Zn-dependent M28 family amino/carboxypeptidase